MARIGYVWVGPIEHNGDFQRSLLEGRGVERVHVDVSPHTITTSRPELTALLDDIASGDTLVVWRLDRLGSSTSGVLSLLELLGKRGVAVESLAEELDTAGADGAQLSRLIGMVTELERTLLRERTLVGVYAARARGRVAGRPRALSDTNVERVLRMRDQGASVREIAEELGTSRATIYRVLDQSRVDAEASAEERPTFTVRIGLPDSKRADSAQF